MNNVTKAIKSTGKSVQEFCEQELNVKYKAFIARVKNNRLYPAEIFYIVWRTKTSVKKLFGMSWQELLITSQGGEIVDKVKDIFSKMSEQEKQEMASLMGLHHAPEAAKASGTTKEASYRIVDEPPKKKENHSEERLNIVDEGLRRFFKPTY